MNPWKAPDRVIFHGPSADGGFTATRRCLACGAWVGSGWAGESEPEYDGRRQVAAARLLGAEALHARRGCVPAEGPLPAVDIPWVAGPVWAAARRTDADPGDE